MAIMLNDRNISPLSVLAPYDIIQDPGDVQRLFAA